MPKYPAFQFYPGDWMRDPALAACALPTRAVWIDLLCAMHENGRSGLITGTTEQLARICRCTAAELSVAITDLQSTRTADIAQRNGVFTVVCRRMRREAKDREAATIRQRKHRGADVECNASHPVTPAPALGSNGSSTPSPGECIPSRERHAPSSSSSSSSEERENTNSLHLADADAPPAAKRKKSKPKTEEPAVRQDDPAYLAFVAGFATAYPTPYVHTKPDFVQLARLRKELNGTATLKDWQIAIGNYFQTPQGTHTMKDLCSRYATFRKGPLDRFGKPVEGLATAPIVPAVKTPICPDCVDGLNRKTCGPCHCPAGDKRR